MEYIENIFTKIIRKEISSEIVFENDSVLVLKDLYPQAKTHLLVLPKGCFIDLNDFLTNASDVEKWCFFDCINVFLKKLAFAKVQFNVGKEAGQEIMHLHAHILSEASLD